MHTKSKPNFDSDFKHQQKAWERNTGNRKQSVWVSQVMGCVNRKKDKYIHKQLLALSTHSKRIPSSRSAAFLQQSKEMYVSITGDCWQAVGVDLYTTGHYLWTGLYIKKGFSQIQILSVKYSSRGWRGVKNKLLAWFQLTLKNVQKYKKNKNKTRFIFCLLRGNWAPLCAPYQFNKKYWKHLTVLFVTE